MVTTVSARTLHAFRGFGMLLHSLENEISILAPASVSRYGLSCRRVHEPLSTEGAMLLGTRQVFVVRAHAPVAVLWTEIARCAALALVPVGRRPFSSERVLVA